MQVDTQPRTDTGRHASPSRRVPGRRPRPGGRRRAPRQRWLLVTGWLLVVGAPLMTLGYLVWEFYGSNIVADHRHQQIVASLEQQWAQPHAGAAGTTDEQRHVDASSADAIIRIPRFGADYAVPVLPGTTAEVLASGFGHYDGTAGPGQVGNYALAAHRVTHGEPLRRMPDLAAGDTVIVETATTTYTYVLDTPGDGLIVPSADTWVVDPLPTNPVGGVEPAQRAGQRLITLTTCSELFHTDNRMVAFGHLVSAVPR